MIHYVADILGMNNKDTAPCNYIHNLSYKKQTQLYSDMLRYRDTS